MNTSALKRLWLIMVLAVIYLKELALSSMAVARAAFVRNPTISPAIIAVPIKLRTNLGIATLANLVSLTPGTTALHVSEDRSTLYVHCLDAPSIEHMMDDIKETFERRIQEIEG
ncbi:TPA: Na+/H+ antiporter subunit E [Pseudomonas aeruginosa]|uniref:Na+/H+ antiporter subunit E n=1 Tax=Pseudomonas aeruginosa TaxID=287 RepID=UPI0005B3822C|nr:Na+/H+ antiporter subunit E [Pseudomonas aeruginosa]MBG3944245.1 Na+/H+ antiporter subunit E [Pseudomonas aeruginosa]MBG5635402.1 Na+/H+ antiporter subunit E [Pseudomonas aeruginosa]MBG6973606.1 Na+/H+ antiporter subunit E [Pseudomonas aeruginosa]MBG7548730.1 Na+/H+ antiporter subunit E [Pseudomonas aeruginosa]MCU9029190.1 Na+/H+ antiporter subunit E [Pseudomonas aeruginosa]